VSSKLLILAGLEGEGSYLLLDDKGRALCVLANRQLKTADFLDPAKNSRGRSEQSEATFERDRLNPMYTLQHPRELVGCPPAVVSLLLLEQLCIFPCEGSDIGQSRPADKCSRGQIILRYAKMLCRLHVKFLGCVNQKETPIIGFPTSNLERLSPSKYQLSPRLTYAQCLHWDAGLKAKLFRWHDRPFLVLTDNQLEPPKKQRSSEQFFEYLSVVVFQAVGKFVYVEHIWREPLSTYTN